MGKSFEKQIKTIEDQGEKQGEALKGLEPKVIESESNNKQSISKDIYNKILEKRMDEILEMSRKINFNSLIYKFKTPSISSMNFIKFKGPMHTYNQLKNGNITLSQLEEDQGKFKSGLGQITSENLNHKEENQLNTIKNVKNLYDSRQKIIDLLNDYSKIRSEAIYKAKRDETKRNGLKILTPKQLFQRLPIALAQVKRSNNTENLLNEIRQIVYSSYQ